MSLKSDLADLGVIRAINEPLPTDDAANVKACARIYNSVPTELRYPIDNLEVAYDMVTQLKRHFEKPSYVQQQAIEKELREMKLLHYDDDAVNKHLKLVKDKLKHLAACGVPLSEHTKCNFLAGTLPMHQLSSTVGDWQNLPENLIYSDQSFEAAGFKVKAHSKLLLSRGLTGFEEISSSFLAKGSRGGSVYRRNNFSRGNFNSGRGVSNFGRKCYLCNGDHLDFMCPDKAEFDKLQANKSKSAQYSSRTYFTSEPHFLDSGATSHHQRTGHRF